MSRGIIALIIVLVIVVALIVFLVFWGRRQEKKQAEQKEQMDAVAQTIPMLVIDKKKMKIKDSGLPTQVLDSVPRYLRGRKYPVVKAKVGSKIMSLMCDPQVFDLIPVKKEVKAVVSGMYITSVKGIRTNLVTPQKKRFRDRFKRNKD